MKKLVYVVFSAIPIPFFAFGLPMTDSDGAGALFVSSDTLPESNKKHELKLNDDAIKQIHFDFMPNQKHQDFQLETTPIKKPWMDFQVDLSVPKNLIDTTKARKPQNYIRMLPYSIWSLFGRDPVYDVLLFGTKKRLEMMMKLDLDYDEDYGRGLMPNAGSYNPNQPIGGVTIKNLDFIGFLYNNLNKHGRMLKHNRKHANAWKTYNKVAPYLSENLYVGNDSVTDKVNDDYSVGQPGLSHHLKSVELTEEKMPKYFEHPDYRLLQTPQQRTRFGTFTNSELYALPMDDKQTDSDSLKVDKNIKEFEEKIDKYLEEELQKQKKNKKKRKERKSKSEKKVNKQEDMLEELPNSMEDLYKYIRAKQAQDSIKRKKDSRNDGINQNVYELEQQQRKLKERQN